MDPIEIKKWYNDYAKKQVHTGTNLRHFTLCNLLISNGLKKHHSVLEIGCGIGTLTKLMHNYLRRGEILATDISDESIEIAKSRISGPGKIDFMVTDMQEFSYPKAFDFIVLPDVLEHIPVEQHKGLFKTLSRHMHDDSILIINIPHPKALDYMRVHMPDKLQVIDQSLSADNLLNDIYPVDLELVSYTSYSLYNREADYVFMKFRKNRNISLTPISKPAIISRKFMERIKFTIARVV
jgi:trans-aconitate 2-methyltransferase